MPIITLTSDLGERDHYVAALKGVLLSALPTLQIVDVSHQIAPFDIAHAAFVLKNAYRHFPKGTVHMVSVESSDNQKSKILLIKNGEHFFIGFDNGLFSLIFEETVEAIYRIEDSENRKSTFPFRDQMAPIAISLLNGSNPENLGTRIDAYKQKQQIQPILDSNTLRGSILYFDHYGNAMSNISKRLFEEAIGNGRFSISFKRNETVQKISQTYSDVPEGEKLCLFNADGFLELAINKGEARRLFGLKIGDIIEIEFQQ